jgi:alkylated DNA repair dioxygenase AlkB
MQLSLWGQAEPAIESGFSRVTRVELDDSSWLDYAPGFLSGHERLFSRLIEHMQWKQERRVMYEREVDVPRLYASAPADGALDPTLAQAGRLLEQRYAATFERVGHAHYRDGQDSVAWHRDKLPRNVNTLVAIISLGAPRRLLVRPFGGGTSRAFSLGAGDLFVMGGLCQTRWEHCVPKLKRAEPRMSCVFRHVYEP